MHLARPFAVMVCMVLEDGLFYWVHRTLHHKALYKHCHHEHHIIKINHVRDMRTTTTQQQQQKEIN